MNMTIGTTTIGITSCTPMRDAGKGVYLAINIHEETIDYANLKALFTDNAEDIVIVSDDETAVTYTGVKELA